MKKIPYNISVVIPVYNGAKTVERLMQELEYSLAQFDEYELIFVDDNSNDNSFEVLKKLAIGNERVTAIRLAENVGQQRATLLGLQKSSGEYVAIIDDDLSHKAEDIINIFEVFSKGYDVVYGINKKIIQKSSLRMFGSKMRDKIFDIMTDKDKNIKVSSFRIMTRELVDLVKHADTKFVYLSMEILRNTTKVGNVMVEYRKGGPTNYNFKRLIKLFWGIYLYYSKLSILNVFHRKFEGYKIEKTIQKGIEI